MKITKATPDLRAAIHLIIVGHMASALRAGNVDLSDRPACEDCLKLTGFGAAQIETLLDRSIALAADASSYLPLPSET
jgi:hypothetical protein